MKRRLIQLTEGYGVPAYFQVPKLPWPLPKTAKGFPGKPTGNMILREVDGGNWTGSRMYRCVDVFGKTKDKDIDEEEEREIITVLSF